MASTKKIVVHAYKFNGLLYRSWEFPAILENSKDYICIDMHNSKVIFWKNIEKKYVFSRITKKSIWYFFDNEWFNLIVSYKYKKFYMYINVASPFIFEEGAIKYIDLDIDFVTNDVFSIPWKELDVDEFNEHKVEMKYPQELIDKIGVVVADLKQKIENKVFDKYAKNAYFNFVEKWQK